MIVYVVCLHLTSQQVKVIFTHPMFISMKPCQFFMEGRCKFTDDKCRYSHGHIVPFSKLKPYQQPNYKYLKSVMYIIMYISCFIVHVYWSLINCSDLNVGSRCLVKQLDGLWIEANILLVD